MTTTESSPVQTVIDAYFGMWNAAGRAERLAFIADAWTTDGHYVDPMSEVTGAEALADMVERVRNQFPGAILARTTDIDAHHDVVKYGWSATGPGGELIVAGTDVGVVAADGRLAAVTGFFS